MWYFLLYVCFAIWVVKDGKKRKANKVINWAIGTVLIGPIVLPVYFAKRPLLAEETREGGTAWNVLKNFALFWTILMAVAAIWGMVNVSEQTANLQTDAERGGAAIGAALGLGLLFVLWIIPLMGALILGFFLKKSSVIEKGPTGQLAVQEPSPSSIKPITLLLAIALSLTNCGGGNSSSKISGGSSYNIPSNEAMAISTLWTIGMGQARSQQNTSIDQNEYADSSTKGNGIGEYAFIQELAGTAIVRGRNDNIYPPHIPEILGETASKNDGIATMSGYNFYMYLPTSEEAGKDYIGETAGDQKSNPQFAKAQENKFICYAWPVLYGKTGNRVFAVDNNLQILWADNLKTQYSGSKKPAFNAALSADGNFEIGQDQQNWSVHKSSTEPPTLKATEKKKVTGIAIHGCTITQQDGGTLLYKERCEKCSTFGGIKDIAIPEYTGRSISKFTCAKPECKKQQTREIAWR